MVISWRRRLLAVYIDYLFVRVVVTLGAAGVLWATGYEASATIRFGLAVGIVFSVGQWAASPGRRVLGIFDGMGDPRVLTRETWWTMLCGFVLVQEGTRSAARIASGGPVPPLLGGGLPDEMVALEAFMLAGVQIYSGIQVFRTEASGALMGAVISGLELVSVLLQPTAFKSWVARGFEARRRARGLNPDGVKPELLEFVSTVFIPGAALLAGLLLICAAVRFSRLSAAEARGSEAPG